MAVEFGSIAPYDADDHKTPKPLDGTVSFVTGASRGIGAAIAAELASRGSHVVIDYLTHDGDAADVLAAITESGGSAECVACDVSKADEVRKTIDAVIERLGHVDVLVNNAGILRDRSLLKMSESEWNEVINVNLSSVMLTSKAVLPHMIANKRGRIVNIASFVAQAGNFGQTNYAAAKAGIIGFTRALALETARHGVTVNAVCPGFIETSMWTSIPDAIRAQIVEKIPMQRVGSPRDVARAVRFLAEEGDYITGQTLNVNGGVFIG
jgi:acetoacetyl-CoA reductase